MGVDTALPPAHPAVDGRGQPEEHTDQAGALIAADGLQLRVPLVLDIKPSQSIDDLEAAAEMSPSETWAAGQPTDTPLKTTLRSHLLMGVMGRRRPGGRTSSHAAWKARALERGPHLVAAQGREDKAILPHSAVWELLLSALIPGCPRGTRELGKLGLAELSGRNMSEAAVAASCHLLSSSRQKGGTAPQPPGLWQGQRGDPKISHRTGSRSRAGGTAPGVSVGLVPGWEGGPGPRD